MDEILEKRLQQLGWKRVDVAREIAKKLNKKTTDVSSRVSSTFNNPGSRSFDNLKEVIEAMGGEIVIRWQVIEEQTVR